MVYAMAEKTGWPETKLMWGMPAWKANVYYLCALRAAGIWFVSAWEEVPSQSSVMPSLEELAEMSSFESVEDLYDFS